MDNAAKALRIAGGVLLGLMVTSLLIFAINAWQKYQKANYQSIQNQQITKFNSTFDVSITSGFLNNSLACTKSKFSLL